MKQVSGEPRLKRGPDHGGHFQNVEKSLRDLGNTCADRLRAAGKQFDSASKYRHAVKAPALRLPVQKIRFRQTHHPRPVRQLPELDQRPRIRVGQRPEDDRVDDRKDSCTSIPSASIRIVIIENTGLAVRVRIEYQRSVTKLNMNVSRSIPIEERLIKSGKVTEEFQGRRDKRRSEQRVRKVRPE